MRIRRITLSLAAALALGSCRELTAPESRAQHEGTTSATTARQRDESERRAIRSPLSEEDERFQVPLVTRIESVADADGLHFRLHLQPERRGDHPFYGPRTPGGWAFQMFLNVDQNPFTGYSHGFEFLTRDSEVDLEPGTLVLRRTEGDGSGPGGWGEEVARIPVHVSPRLVMFTVPLGAIEDDGLVNFSLEMYAIVSGGDDGVTPVGSFVRYYIGSSSLRHDRQAKPLGPRTLARR